MYHYVPCGLKSAKERPTAVAQVATSMILYPFETSFRESQNISLRKLSFWYATAWTQKAPLPTWRCNLKFPGNCPRLPCVGQAQSNSMNSFKDHGSINSISNGIMWIACSKGLTIFYIKSTIPVFVLSLSSVQMFIKPNGQISRHLKGGRLIGCLAIDGIEQVRRLW